MPRLNKLNMFALLRPLLVVSWYLQLPGGDASSNQFHYQHINTGNGNSESTCVLNIWFSILFYINRVYIGHPLFFFFLV